MINRSSKVYVSNPHEGELGQLGDFSLTLSQEEKMLGTCRPHAHCWRVQMAAAAKQRSELVPCSEYITLAFNTQEAAGWMSPSRNVGEGLRLAVERAPSQAQSVPAKKTSNWNLSESFSLLFTSPCKGACDFLIMGKLTGLSLPALYFNLICSKVGSPGRKSREGRITSPSLGSSNHWGQEPSSILLASLLQLLELTAAPKTWNILFLFG